MLRGMYPSTLDSLDGQRFETHLIANTAAFSKLLDSRAMPLCYSNQVQYLSLASFDHPTYHHSLARFHQIKFHTKIYSTKLSWKSPCFGEIRVLTFENALPHSSYPWPAFWRPKLCNALPELYCAIFCRQPRI